MAIQISGTTVIDNNRNISNVGIITTTTMNVSRSYSSPSTLTDGTTITIDMSTRNNFTVTLAGNRTLGDPTNKTEGQSGIIRIVQDATGNRTLAFNSVWKFPYGVIPSLTTTANSVDLLAYYIESSTRISANLTKQVS
jgi:hypothetical protein